MKHLCFITLCLVVLSILACTNDKKEITSVTSTLDMSAETATEVVMLYSDSAQVKVRIKSPIMKRYHLDGEAYDEFPEGLLVEFLTTNKKVNSWLTADYAIRKEKEKKIFVEKNVVLYNKKNDKLETEELVWDEGLEEIYTSRPVRISQPSIGDTSFGYGFRADQEFTRFEIKSRLSAIKNVEKLTDGLDK